MILRAKTKYLFDKFPLSEQQRKNSSLNLQEIEDKKTCLTSYPRRLVLELTNACNLHCIMCGRESIKFTPTFFKTEWLGKLKIALENAEEVALFGWGEPTVHPRFAEILQYLDSYHVDIIVISLDGATAETNNRIRAGGDFDKIIVSLREIVEKKKELNIKIPYMNFVFCAMKSNYRELPDLIQLAANIGMEEVKVVYFTTFTNDLKDECLWDNRDEVAKVFAEATQLAEQRGIVIKLPYLPGEDPAGDKFHRDCFVGWRDLFLGSDGYVRPCMSTPDKFFRFTEIDDFERIWNHPSMQNFRRIVNDNDNMLNTCRHCYQSSHCNWNKRESFFQMDGNFVPEWEKS